MVISSKQNKYLKSIGATMSAKYQVGKNGLSENQIQDINNYLNKHEIVKIKLLQNLEEDKNIIAKKVAINTNSELVQVIGRQIILFKKTKDGSLFAKVKGIK